MHVHVGSVLSAAKYGSTGYGYQSLSWLAEQGKWIFPCPSSRLRIWSHRTGLAVQFRASTLILHAQAQFGAYSRGPLPSPSLLPSVFRDDDDDDDENGGDDGIYLRKTYTSPIRATSHRASAPEAEVHETSATAYALPALLRHHPVPALSAYARNSAGRLQPPACKQRATRLQGPLVLLHLIRRVPGDEANGGGGVGPQEENLHGQPTAPHM